MPSDEKENAAINPNLKQILAFSIEDDDKDVRVVINNPVILIYNTFVNTAERAIESRLVANRFYMSASGAVFLLFSFLATEGPSLTPPTDRVVMCGLLLALSAVQLFWATSILAARRLSSSKYAVIQEIEAEHLPIGPFTREWRIYKSKPRSWFTQTRIELTFPIVLGIVSFIAMVLIAVGILAPPI